MIKAVLFDVDGVLIDTLEANARAYSHDFVLLGGKPITPKAYRKFYHLPARKMFKHFFPEKPDEEIEKMLEERIGRAPQFFRYMRLFPGVKETLQKLHKDFRLGIVTSRRTIGVLDFFRIGGYFGAVITPDHVKNTKPHPEPILLALKRLKARPEESVYVGDAASDLEAGKAAGVKVIIYRNPSVKGNFNIKDLGEIFGIVERMNKRS